MYFVKPQIDSNYAIKYFQIKDSHEKIICLALAYSSITFASGMEHKELTLKGIKPFVGIMVGTLTKNSAKKTDFFIQTGLWGGLEFNFMENLGIRVYANIISTALGTEANTTSSLSQTHMIFSGNADFIYRPTQNFGIFLGLGLGDTLLMQTIKGVVNNTQFDNYTENYSTTMTNFGVQYNINTNNILEFGVIINQQWVFTAAPNYIEKLYAPKSVISYSIVGKYAYRF